MPPPKKDAFSDLFQASLNGHARGTTRLSMLEQQRLRSSPNAVSNPEFLSPKPHQGLLSQSNASNLPKNDAVDDIFALFDKPSKPVSSSVSSGVGVLPNLSRDTTPTPHMAASEALLLGDEFTDLCVSLPRIPSPQLSATVHENSAYDADPHIGLSPSRPASSRDGGLALLLDMGYSMDEATDAWEHAGPNIQACAEYLMSRQNSRVASPSIPRPSRTSSRPSMPLLADVFGASILSTANKLFAKSKQAVLQNIELLAQPSPRDGVPPWLRTVERYQTSTDENVLAAEPDLLSKEEWIQRHEMSDRTKTRSPQKRGLPIPSLSKHTTVENSSDDSLPIKPRRPTKSDDPLPQRPTRPSKDGVSASRPPSTFLSHPHETTVMPQAQSVLIPLSVPDPVNTEAEASHDLLGLNEPAASPQSAYRDSTPLNQFNRVDYDTVKQRAHEAFTHGNYADALVHYSTCIQSLPPRHELRVVIGSNLANVHKLLGELKPSLECVDAAIDLIGPDLQSGSIHISGKPIRYWVVKLLTCRAEVLELLERFPQCLDVYDTLVKQYGVRDKKIADARNRAHKIVNPEVHRPKKTPSKPLQPAACVPRSTAKPVKKVDSEPTLSFEATERIAALIDTWTSPKNNNLRLLLVELDGIVPSIIALLQKLRHLTGTDLTLPKQVKAQYLRVISAIHPDKLALQCKQDPESAQLGHEIFIVLSLAWDRFRAENDL